MASTHIHGNPAANSTINERNFQQFLVHVGYSDDDEAILKGLKGWAESNADTVIRHFYDRQFGNAEFKRAVDVTGSSRERLSVAQKRYFLDWFNGRPDATYVRNRQFIGSLHAHIDIQPMWFLTAYQFYYDTLSPMLRKHFAFRRGNYDRAMAAITKLITFDQAVIMDAHTSTLVGQIEDTLETISVTSNEVSRAVGDFAAGTQGQAASAQSVMGTIAEVSRTVDDVAGAASEAASFSDKSNQAAVAGAKVIREMVSAIERIDATASELESQVGGLQGASNEIRRVIDTIDSIAQETNLLALNAAIEAARAAEHGRGFAVVAEEVRALAVTTQSETKLISDVIHQLTGIVDSISKTIATSGEDARRGREMADLVRESLNEIVNTVKHAAGESEQIAALSEEISAALRQVVNEVESITGVIEQSSAASEQLAATANSLADMANQRHVERRKMLEARGLRAAS